MVCVIVQVITFNWNRYKGEEVEFTSWFSSMIIEQSKAKPAHKDGPVAVFPTSMYARSGLNKNKKVLFERGAHLWTALQVSSRHGWTPLRTIMQNMFLMYYIVWHSHVLDHLWDSVFLVPTSCGIREITPCSHKLWNKPSHVAMETLWMDPGGSFWTTFWSIAWNYRCRSLPVKKVWHHPRPCATFLFCFGVTTHSFLNLTEYECAAPWIQ